VNNVQILESLLYMKKREKKDKIPVKDLCTNQIKYERSQYIEKIKNRRRRKKLIFFFLFALMKILKKSFTPLSHSMVEMT
jgi:hypothetical protein